MENKLITQIIDCAKDFQKLVLSNWDQVDDKTLNLVMKEYLTFLMYYVIFMLQNNDLPNSELDNFTRSFYKKIVEAGLLRENELLDYEKLSRERYTDFYQILCEGTEKDQLDGKRLNALAAKEVLFIQDLLSGSVEKDGVLGEIYPEIFSACNGLMLTTQLVLKT
jgi:hypothetical protein